MLERYLFLGYSEGKITPKENCGASYIVAARQGDAVILYAEAEGGMFVPENAVDADMKAFPDGRLWVRLPNIFYYNIPESPHEWARREPSVPRISIARLKCDAVAPYVFYHYQLQEENRKRQSRYYIIGLLGNLLVSYDETPSFPAEPRCGCLKTRNTPEKGWQNKMKEYLDVGWTKADIVFREDCLWKKRKLLTIG